MLAAAELAFGPYLLDSRTRSLACDGRHVGLSKYEYQVLHVLVQRPHVVHSKDALLRAGWHDTAVGDNSLEKLVGKLRRRLDATDPNRYIKTVPTWTYCWRPTGHGPQGARVWNPFNASASAKRATRSSGCCSSIPATRAITSAWLTPA